MVPRVEFRLRGRRGEPIIGRKTGGPLIVYLLVAVAILNAAIIVFVFARRFVKEWYFSVLDERRLLAAAEVEQALDRARRGEGVPRPRHPALADEVLFQRIRQAPSDEAQLLQGFFREWGRVEHWRWRLRQGSLGDRGYAAIVLGRMQVQEALPEIVPLLAVRDTEVQLAAVRALELLADPAAIEPLVRALPPFTPTAWRLFWSALLACGRTRPKQLLAHLSHPDPAVRTVVASAVADVTAPWLAPLLAKHADDPEPEVRSRIARAMGRTGQASLLPVLTRMARDPVWFVRLQAVGALGALQRREALETLLGTLGDADRQVREKAAAALLRVIGDPMEFLDLAARETLGPAAQRQLVAELARQASVWEAVNRVNSPLAGAREQSRELLRRLIERNACTAVLYAIEVHPDLGVRQALVELMAESMPASRRSELEHLLGSSHLDSATRQSIQEAIGGAKPH